MTGLALAPNSIEPQQSASDPGKQLEELMVLTDWVRYSLAGNLRWGTEVDGGRQGDRWGSESLRGRDSAQQDSGPLSV